LSLSNIISTYEDCFELFQRALDHEVGVRVPIGDYGSARFFQMRMHNGRALMRAENRRIYLENDIRWGKSIYDVLTVLLRQDTTGVWWIYVKRPTHYRMCDVEELDDETNLSLNYQAPKLLEDLSKKDPPNGEEP
jgi:hypothetical protein